MKVTEYIQPSSTTNLAKTKVAAKTSLLNEVYYTRPLKVTEANVFLLEEFLRSSAYIDLDGYKIKLSVEEYLIENTARRIQLAFSFQRLSESHSLIDSYHNSI